MEITHNDKVSISNAHVKCKNNTEKIKTLEEIISNMQSDILKLGERIKYLEFNQPYESTGQKPIENLNNTSPMPYCKPPKKSEKQEALERIQYLESMLKKAYTDLTERSYEHGELCITLGKPLKMCLATFDNLDRICNDVKKAIEKI